jgi:hypothetical protein
MILSGLKQNDPGLIAYALKKHLFYLIKKQTRVTNLVGGKFSRIEKTVKKVKRRVIIIT